jgi:hypothetical protein
VNPYTFLLDTYATQRLKTLSVWSHFDEKDLGFEASARRIAPPAERPGPS